MNVRLRAAAHEDSEFVVRVESETMQTYAVQTWGTFAAAESRERAIRNLAAGRTQIIELDGVHVGILRVERSAESIDLKQIFILPEFQRRGVGSELLHHLMREAEATRLPLKLRVLRVNPAVHLYERLGFSVVNASAEHVYMAYAV